MAKMYDSTDLEPEEIKCGLLVNIIAILLIPFGILWFIVEKIKAQNKKSKQKEQISKYGKEIKDMDFFEYQETKEYINGETI